MTVTKFI